MIDQPMAESPAERHRLEALASYNILDTLPEAEYDDLTRLAAHICQTPISLISLLDDHRQWFKSAHGLPMRQTPRQVAFCDHVLRNRQFMEVSDARLDARFAANPLTTDSPGIVFYAGEPLITPAGQVLGTLCVIDHEPHQLTEDQKNALAVLARQVVTLLELRRSHAHALQTRQTLQDANRRLARQHQLVRAVVDATPAGLALLEPVYGPEQAVTDFRFVLTNPAMAATTHRSQEEMTGRTLLNLFPQAGKLGLFDRMVHVLESGEAQQFQQHYQDDSINAHIEGCLQVSGDGVLFTFMDVSPLVQQTQEKEKARKEAVEALQVRDTFLANVSHDLRTPLNSILGFSELLAGKWQGTPEGDYVHNIQVAGRNLLQLINSLLDVAKLDSGQLELEQAPTSLAEVLETVTSLMAVQASRKELAFTMQLDPSLPRRVQTDPLRLTQILLNLCSNAVKFTARGSVSLSAAVDALGAEEVLVSFRVSDTGIGIAPDRLAHVFERYTQSSASISRQYGGTGLGLNIVRSLVEQMQGTIRVESEPGRGTTMRVTLPFRLLAEKVQPVAPPAAQTDRLPSGLSILLVEDNSFNQKLVNGILGAQGVQLRVVNNGVEALAALRNQVPDLVLLDIQMPLMDGYRTAHHIRRTLQLPVPIVAMTANAMASERDACLQAGMNDYLSKPFTKAQLLAKIGQWVRYKTEPDSRSPFSLAHRLDEEHLRESFAGMPDLLTELFAEFDKEWPGEVRRLSALLESGQNVAFGQEAHRLRSSLYALGMHPAAEKLHAIGEEFTTLTAEVRELHFTAFADLMEESIRALQERIGADLPVTA